MAKQAHLSNFLAEIQPGVSQRTNDKAIERLVQLFNEASNVLLGQVKTAVARRRLAGKFSVTAYVNAHMKARKLYAEYEREWGFRLWSCYSQFMAYLSIRLNRPSTYITCTYESFRRVLCRMRKAGVLRNLPERQYSTAGLKTVKDMTPDEIVNLGIDVTAEEEEAKRLRYSLRWHEDNTSESTIINEPVRRQYFFMISADVNSRPWQFYLASMRKQYGHKKYPRKDRVGPARPGKELPVLRRKTKKELLEKEKAETRAAKEAERAGRRPGRVMTYVGLGYRERLLTRLARKEKQANDLREKVNALNKDMEKGRRKKTKEMPPEPYSTYKAEEMTPAEVDQVRSRLKELDRLIKGLKVSTAISSKVLKSVRKDKRAIAKEKRILKKRKELFEGEPEPAKKKAGKAPGKGGKVKGGKVGKKPRTARKGQGKGQGKGGKGAKEGPIPDILYYKEVLHSKDWPTFDILSQQVQAGAVTREQFDLMVTERAAGYKKRGRPRKVKKL